MFKPKTEKIEKLANTFSTRILELENIFSQKTRIYIDVANVRPWAEKLGWNIDFKRLKQFFDSFDTIEDVRIYDGLLSGDSLSEKNSKIYLNYYGTSYVTKKVKILKKSVDVSSIAMNSPDILKNFIRNSLLINLRIKIVECLNGELKDLNRRGVFYIEDRKCNFDVEIGRDISLDLERNNCECFVLWSGDSDFVSSIDELLDSNKKVYLFATTGKISSELSQLARKGLKIYDIKKIRDFICWNREIKSVII